MDSNTIDQKKDWLGQSSVRAAIENFWSLDAPSILVLRQTNGLLCDISKTSDVWSNALRSFVELNPALAPQLDRPKSAYTSRELEALVVKLIKLQKNWTDDSPNPTQMREIAFQDFTECGTLVPGGRWLLTGKTDHLAFYDLDNLNPTERVLIQPTDAAEMARPYTIVVSVETNEPLLTFYVLMAFQTPEILKRRAVRYSVWRVILDVDYSGLSAHHVPFFTVRASNFANVVVHGNLLGKLGGSAHRGYQLRIYQWDDCTLSTHNMCTIYLSSPDRPEMPLVFLPDRRVLVMGEKRVDIYDIPTTITSAAHCKEMEGKKVLPCWTMNFGVAPRYSLAASLSQTNQLLHFTNGTTFYRVQIPKDGSVNFEVVSSIALSLQRESRTIMGGIEAYVGIRR
ncbi:hypothetical protein FRB93_014040 [Tulasnella sp. JGI-2019a]|nr:hypothetical protein FRB93_014040 [Tulasnella sp. JGI-2019a]